METYTADEFRTLFLAAVQRTHAIAQAGVADPLPIASIFALHAFGQDHRLITANEVLPYLYREGTFPRVVVMSVQGILDDQTVVGVGPSGHTYVRDRALTWCQPPEMGPFNCVGLALGRGMWERPCPLMRRDLEDAAAR